MHESKKRLRSRKWFWWIFIRSDVKFVKCLVNFVAQVIRWWNLNVEYESKFFRMIFFNDKKFFSRLSSTFANDWWSLLRRLLIEIFLSSFNILWALKEIFKCFFDWRWDWIRRTIKKSLTVCKQVDRHFLMIIWFCILTKTTIRRILRYN